MHLTFGTTNPAKIAQIQSVLQPRGIEVVGLSGPKITVVEDGNSAEENARKKAVAYAAHTQKPVLSMDNALYFKELAEHEQPGLYVRRVNGKDEVSDEEAVAYYAALAQKHGGELTALWHFALAVATPAGKTIEYTLKIPPRRFVSTPFPTFPKGYPLESLQIDPETGKYVAEMTTIEHDVFWQRTIGKNIGDFVERALRELGLA